jgi:hypothetical protein
MFPTLLTLLYFNGPAGCYAYYKELFLRHDVVTSSSNTTRDFCDFTQYSTGLGVSSGQHWRFVCDHITRHDRTRVRARAQSSPLESEFLLFFFAGYIPLWYVILKLTYVLLSTTIKNWNSEYLAHILCNFYPQAGNLVSVCMFTMRGTVDCLVALN